VTAADGDDELAARLHRCSSFRSYDLRSLSGDRIGVGKNFNLHDIS
jgi:hypothetical protein